MDDMEIYSWFSKDGVGLAQMNFKDWFKWYKYVIYKYNTEEVLSISTWDLLELLIDISVVVHDDFTEAFYYLRDDLLEIREEIIGDNRSNGNERKLL